MTQLIKDIVFSAYFRQYTALGRKIASKIKLEDIIS